MNINMKHYLGLAIFGLALTFLLPSNAKAADCGNDPVYERNWTGKTTIGSRVRDWACMEVSEILTVLPAGTQVHIIAETDGWYKVNVGDKTGWVGARLIEVTSQEAVNPKEAKTTTVKADKPALSQIIGIDEGNFAKLKNGDRGLRARLAGMVVLRVHFHGEAYLVNSDGSLKLLTADEVKAIKSGAKAVKEKDKEVKKEVKEKVVSSEVKIRKIVGIDEGNFAKLEAGDLGLRDRLNDQIVLRVNYHGKAYWVNPAGGLKFLEKSEIGHYLTATPATKEKNEEKSEIITKDEPQTSGTITLEGQLTDPGKVKLVWSTSELDASKGFKVVMSESANPVYPGNKYHYLTNPSVRQDYWSGLANGKTYHFRVCQYLGGKCGVYSNDIAITVATNGAFAENIMPGNIDLSVTPVSGGKAEITWSLTDMTSPKGFKVVIDEAENPVYPGNEYHYYSDPDKHTDTWTGLKAGQTYHFRVCEYLGGYCGTYSNDVSITAL